MKQVRVVRRNLHSPGFTGALLVLLGIAGLGLSVPLLHHRANLRAKDWPATTGEVVRFERHLYDGTRGESCEIRLRYRYSVGGREYSARRLWYGGGTGCFDPHLPELHAGQKVSVAFDPGRPRHAVLVRSHPLHQFELVLGAVCALPALSVFLFGLLPQRQRQVEAPPHGVRPTEPGAAADSGP